MLLLVRGFDRQIVQENKTQTNFGSGKCRRQMVKRIRGANRGNRRAIERLFAGSKQLLRILVRYAPIAADAELQNDSPAVTQLRGFWHYRIPIAAHACQHALHVVIEVDAFGRRQNLISAVHSRARNAPTAETPSIALMRARNGCGKPAALPAAP